MKRNCLELVYLLLAASGILLAIYGNEKAATIALMGAFCWDAFLLRFRYDRP